MDKIALYLVTIVGWVSMVVGGQVHAGKLSIDYVGAEACKACHDQGRMGHQWQKWSESAHARSWRSLGSEAGRQIAASKDIDDPQSSALCLSCHTTVGVPDPTAGVQCESCHGPGGKYIKAKIFSVERARKLGLTVPTAAVCQECHSGQCPPDDGFNYRVMKLEIAHPLATRDGSVQGANRAN